jgi:hypothetical protein
MKRVFAEPDSKPEGRYSDERREYRSRVARQLSENYARILKVASGKFT